MFILVQFLLRHLAHILFSFHLFIDFCFLNDNVVQCLDCYCPCFAVVTVCDSPFLPHPLPTPPSSYILVDFIAIFMRLYILKVVFSSFLFPMVKIIFLIEQIEFQIQASRYDTSLIHCRCLKNSKPKECFEWNYGCYSFWISYNMCPEHLLLVSIESNSI